MAPRITKDEQGGKVVLAFALMLGYSIISVAIRLHTRWPWTKLFRREDAVLLIATAVSIGYTATMALAVDNGLGTRETENTTAHVKFPEVETTMAVSFVLFFLTEGLGTISYGLFLVSLAEDDRAIIVRLNFTPANVFHAGFTADTVDFLIIMIVEMHFHIINATYPNLLVFAEKATTGFIINGAPRTLSITALPSSQTSSDGQEKRSFSLSQRFKFLSNRSPSKSQTYSRSSETETGASQGSGDAGD
ncbi:hypothetical protein PRZ48_003905 [Zasmidium cellare]|uniref:Integral membrane protein n=1 Tax=Zasmidium cellare TaxID=395010 RepID=A0ABR0EWY9_ZASCE|nr:hypothetical protein PRZ48_003905 [Zasmidium cellare]